MNAWLGFKTDPNNPLNGPRKRMGPIFIISISNRLLFVSGLVSRINAWNEKKLFSRRTKNNSDPLFDRFRDGDVDDGDDDDDGGRCVDGQTRFDCEKKFGVQSSVPVPVRIFFSVIVGMVKRRVSGKTLFPGQALKWRKFFCAWEIFIRACLWKNRPSFAGFDQWDED